MPRIFLATTPGIRSRALVPTMPANPVFHEKASPGTSKGKGKENLKGKNDAEGKGGASPKVKTERIGVELMHMVQELLDVGDEETLQEVIETAADLGFEIDYGEGKYPGPGESAASVAPETLPAGSTAPPRSSASPETFSSGVLPDGAGIL